MGLALITPISASHIARIMGVSHWCPAWKLFFKVSDISCLPGVSKVKFHFPSYTHIILTDSLIMLTCLFGNAWLLTCHSQFRDRYFHMKLTQILSVSENGNFFYKETLDPYGRGILE
jgi:hypothetical protein